jgi:ATP-dependent Lon protease
MNRPTRLTANTQIYDSQKINEMMYSNAQTVPPFHGMPSSVSRISTGPVEETYQRPEAQKIVSQYTRNTQSNPEPVSSFPSFDLRGHTLEELAAAANVNVSTIQAAIEMRQQQLMEKQQQEMFFMQQLQQQQQQQMIAMQTTTTTTTTTTTRRPSTTTLFTQKPRSKYPVAVNGHKVG